mgnify:CR=1 FL=1
MHTDIDGLIQAFFALFDNRAPGKVPLEGLEAILMPEAIIAKRSGNRLEVMSLEAFVEPRRKLLSDGTLTAFHEWEVGAETFVFGGIASRTSRYRKEGILNGIPYAGEGMKSTHLVLTEHGWRISAIVWEDFDDEMPSQEPRWCASGAPIRA